MTLKREALALAAWRVFAAASSASTRGQVMRAERLLDVVVGARVVADLDALVVHARGKQNHGDPPGRIVLAEQADDVEPGQLRHAYVEDDQVGVHSRASTSASCPSGTVTTS